MRNPLLLVGLAISACVTAGAGRPAEASAGGPPIVSFAPSKNAVVLADAARVAPVAVDSRDWPGVVRAAGDLQADIERVTGRRPRFEPGAAPAGDTAIIIGTIGRSRLVDRLAARGKIDVSKVRGRWESYLIQAVNAPLPGVARALVIAGSDKRGTIFGIYEISEQIGMSPWYWWTDVPPARASSTRRTSARPPDRERSSGGC